MSNSTLGQDIVRLIGCVYLCASSVEGTYALIHHLLWKLRIESDVMENKCEKNWSDSYLKIRCRSFEKKMPMDEVRWQQTLEPQLFSPKTTLLLCAGHPHHPHPSTIHPPSNMKTSTWRIPLSSASRTAGLVGFRAVSQPSPMSTPRPDLIMFLLWGISCIAIAGMFNAKVLTYLKVTSTTWWNLARIFKSLFASHVYICT